ncbi:hypothetical protein AB0C60_07175, partial [Streptomyces sp. NPDC048845]
AALIDRITARAPDTELFVATIVPLSFSDGTAPPSEGGDGKPGDGRTPCPRSQAPEQPSDGGSPGTTGPADSPEPSSGAPGDSTSHTLPPGDGCVIESGIPAMPVDP